MPLRSGKPAKAVKPHAGTYAGLLSREGRSDGREAARTQLMCIPKDHCENAHMEGTTRKVDWIVVVRGKRMPASTQEILFDQATGPRTRTKYRYRLCGAGSSGRLKSRRIDEKDWWDKGDRSVGKGGWSDLVATVETELRACRNIERVTRTTP
jgi:hypothetical protein